MQWLGKVSYPWYLWHWSILILAPYIWPHVTFTWPLNLGLMVFALAPAAATYYALEEPTRKWKFRRSVWAAAGLALMTAGVATGTLIDSNYQHALAWYRALRSLGETFPIWRIHRLIGMGGDKLAEKWKHAPSTFLGMLTHGFPNLLMPTGPQSASASTNFPRGIENGVNWCTDLLQYMWDRGYSRANATQEAQERWTAHVVKMYEIMLMRKAKSWFTGYNSNVAGHEEGTVRYFVYNGGTPKFVGIINDVAAKKYQEIAFSSLPGAKGEAKGHAAAAAARA